VIMEEEGRETNSISAQKKRGGRDGNQTNKSGSAKGGSTLKGKNRDYLMVERTNGGGEETTTVGRVKRCCLYMWPSEEGGRKAWRRKRSG